MRYEVYVKEVRHVTSLYTVEAENPRRAARMAERGETISESFVGTDYLVSDRYLVGSPTEIPAPQEEGTVDA